MSIAEVVSLWFSTRTKEYIPSMLLHFNLTIQYQDSKVPSFIAEYTYEYTLLLNALLLFMGNSALSCQQGRWS